VSSCPRCGSDVEPGQEYCLACGDRLPDPGPVGRGRERAKGWQRRSAVALVVALAGAAVAVAASDPGSDSAAISTATGDVATVPTTSTLPSPVDAPRTTGGDWPAGEDGWTIALASVPQTKGRRLAVARAREARRKDLAQVGILDSSGYASLHPGYWVVFAGVYDSEAEATSALEPARKVVRTATVRRVVP
jgi:hypothetical protein